MDILLSKLRLKINQDIFLKDPETTELGNHILESGLDMIDKLGLESFTFKKLAVQLQTAESSIYRYFENKHKLLIYFTNYYWALLEYFVVFKTNNLISVDDKLRIAIDILCNPTQLNDEGITLSLNKLNRIVIAESSKSFMTKAVDSENKAGFFEAYKNITKRLSQIITEINTDYPYARTLASTCIEGMLHQQYFAQHMPALTDFNNFDKSQRADIFYQIIKNNINH